MRVSHSKDGRERKYFNILDNVSTQMRARFDDYGELAFLGLVDCAKFNKYDRFFDLVRLKSDLIGLYSSEEVRSECKSPLQLLNFVAKNNLTKTVPEATKLLQLVLTIPATTASVERSFSALKRIKTYSRNRTNQGRLSSLAIISIEAERLLKLKAKGKKDPAEDFYNKVTEIFVQKERRMDFIFK